MFEELLRVAHRWRRVTILLDSNYPSLKYCKELHVVHPVNLEHFGFCPQVTLDDPSEGRKLRPKIFTLGAPKLISLRLDITSYQSSLPPCSNIVTLRLENPFSSALARETSVHLKLITSLLAIPTLENLSLSGLRIIENFREDGIRMIHMKKLKDLRYGSESIMELLSYIEAPCLHTLTLRNVSIHSRIPRTSFPTLTNLILLNCNVPWTAFTHELSHIASRITSLTVSEDSRGTFSLHAVTELTVTHWPQLRSLSCNIQPVSNLELYIQIALLRSNHPFTLRIHRHLLDVWSDRTPRALLILQEACTIQPWDEMNPLLPRQWPYSDDFHVDHVYDELDHDQFRVVSYH